MSLIGNSALYATVYTVHSRKHRLRSERQGIKQEDVRASDCVAAAAFRTVENSSQRRHTVPDPKRTVMLPENGSARSKDMNIKIEDAQQTLLVP